MSRAYGTSPEQGLAVTCFRGGRGVILSAENSERY